MQEHVAQAVLIIAAGQDEDLRTSNDLLGDDYCQDRAGQHTFHSLDDCFLCWMVVMDRVPGFVPQVLLVGDVSLLRADQQVFGAMLSGWRSQMLARGLTTATIASRCRLIERFQAFTNEYPWVWRPMDVDEFLAERRSGERPISLSTLRGDSNAISMFCSYIGDSRYGWVPFCERTFGDVPSQICFEWNTVRHTTDDAVSPSRRAFTKAELQHLFDVVDDFVDEQHRRGSKRWLPALRDSTAFKVGYAYGLRRRELTMLDTTDFGPNPHVEAYGNFGAVTVRWAKGTKGSGPRRRTVLTSPEFEWVVELLQFWCSPNGRGRFATADRSNSLWPTERRDRVNLQRLGASFAFFRNAAGLPAELGLHALRHSYVTHLIEAGYDPLFVQQQVGHSYSSTTALYTLVSSDFKQKVVQKMIAQRIRTEADHG